MPGLGRPTSSVVLKITMRIDVNGRYEFFIMDIVPEPPF